MGLDDDATTITMTTGSTTSTVSTTEQPLERHPEDEFTKNPMVVIPDIDIEEEIPESSKEANAVEEIFPHRGWNPIKYR